MLPFDLSAIPQLSGMFTFDMLRSMAILVR